MTDETVLITGCSSGIGRATAQYFNDDGWTVYATSRETDDLADLAEAGCHTAALDVREAADIDRVVDRIVDEQNGRIDCLVNNAGYGQYGAVEDIPADKLHRQFDVNVYGPHRLVRAVLPHMRDREDGTIINISSVAGRVVTPGGGVYSASKFALEAMSDALRTEADGFGVDVVVIKPSPVETEFSERVHEELNEGTERRPVYDWVYELVEDGAYVAGQSPLAVSPDEVAQVIHDAAEVDDPDPRYAVGRGAKLMLYSRFLPDRFRDAPYRILRRIL